MLKVLDKMQWQAPRMFAFLEHPGVDSTNNASERALRYIVVFREIIGQTKGGPLARGAWSILPHASPRGGIRARACTRGRPTDIRAT